MARPRLSTVLIALNSGLALAAIAVIALAAVGLLRQLADEQALARVAQAGASARNAIARAGDNALVTARLLRERPTLLRLLRDGDFASLQTFLEQYCQTGLLAGCAVWQNGQRVAASGWDQSWEALYAARPGDDVYFIAASAGQTPFLLAASAVSADPAGAVVMVVLVMDDAFAADIAAEAGLPVSVVAEAALPALGLAAPQITQAVRGETVTAQAGGQERYLSVQTLPAPAGQSAGWVAVSLSAAAIEQSVQGLAQTLAALALGVGLAVAAGSWWLSRRLSRPLGALTEAAERIGRGDFSTPVPRAASSEIGLLADTLDEMRRRLRQLTSDLRTQQAESRAILAGVTEGVFTVDRERRIQFVNPQVARLLGVEPEALLGRFCGEVLDPQGPVRPCDEQCPIVHARFQAGARATEQLRLPDGRRRTVVITSAPPSVDLAGGVRQIQMLRDETDVEAVRRLRDAVLANISHEFRTPLSAQLASIELLLDQLPDLTHAEIEGLVIALQRGTLRLTQLIDNLLESVRLEAGQAAIRRQPVALGEVVAQALELTRPLLQQRAQTVRLELPAAWPPLVGDGPRLVQVLVNLLANAHKFAPAGSVIVVGGAVDRQAVRLWVADQGPGLPPVDAGALFAPFVRSTSEEPEAKGIGLGLWIVKSIVERHGGRVSAENTPDGARLTLWLPHTAASEHPAAPT